MEENPLPPPPPVPPVPSGLTPPATTICPFCNAVVPANSIFCPVCGKQIQGKELSTTVFTQISLYAVAILLPPLGLWPGIKYFKSADPKGQRLGIYLILATIASTIMTLWLTFAFLQSYLNDINNALNGTGITPSQATGGLF
jgi:hypothetical protein